MCTHVVAWNFKPEIKEEEKEGLKAEMKKNLEGLAGKVPGILSVYFICDPLPGSNREMCLITTHEKAEDIAVYACHPAHVAVADTFVRPYTADRTCVNFS